MGTQNDHWRNLLPAETHLDNAFCVKSGGKTPIFREHKFL